MTANATISCSLHSAPVTGYAGDILSQDAHNFLARNDAYLVDVRTPPEWQAGIADLGAADAHLLMISWKILPGYTLNPAFAAELQEKIPSKNTPLLFMCKSGGRSSEAASAMTQAGYANCYNVSGGFESAAGWKAAQLPWKKA